MFVGEEPEREEDALDVFLLMGKEYRISRSIRAQWFFQQFNSTLPSPKPKDELIGSNEELEVLSVIPNNQRNPGPYRLVPSTHITFIGRRYRFVFCLDISPSLATVDIQSGTVITDEAFEKLKNCLCGLVAPFCVPGNSIVLSPELYITVLAYTSILNPEVPQVLIQGCLVTEQNVNTVLELIQDQLKGLEDFLAKTTSTLHGYDGSEESNKAESDQGGRHQDSVTLMSPEAGPIAIMRNTLLALQLLPCNASAGAVVITDGVFALPDASAVDSLLAQFRASTVCCSFIKVGSGFHAHCSLAYVPHCDLMQFIAMASSGAYLANAPPVSRAAKGADGAEDFTMNLYHKALLCWSFQRDFDLSKIDSWIGDCLELSSEDLAWAFKGKRSMSYALSEWEKNAMQPSMRKRHLETKLHTSITSVLSVRLREGYSIQDVSITKGGKQLQVTLTIPWKHNVQIEYLALSAWPLTPTNRITHVEVTIEAPYEFLHDVLYPTKQPFTSGYRTLVVRRFRQTMKSLQSADEMLVHLQSFSSNSSYYTIPESTKNGVPLFYLPPNSNNPILSLQHARKSSKSPESQFAVFWKPVLSVDTTGWQRWMHCHRIGLVLDHDVPLPKNLNLPMENDRSSAIQCRVALSSLTSLCRNWSSFVLLENHSFIKFISSNNPEDVPSSFCLTRITVKGPCIVIRVAFLGGTPGHIRHEIVSDLKTKLSKIEAPLGVNLKPQKSPVKGKSLQRAAQISNKRAVAAKPCTIMFDKPLEKILVRYEKIPEGMLTPFPERPHYSVYPSLTGVYANRTNENHMKVLCHYLHHHRWIWTMQEEGSPAVPAEDVARVLSTLTKLRLQEGYNFVNNNAGIITMAKELIMKDHTKEDDQFYSCIIQYVLFPPYLQPSEAGRGEEAIADWTLEGKPALGNTRQKFNMVTEVWAEPQFGVLTDLPSELKYLDGLKYNEVPDAIFQVDLKHVSALLTYDHLWAMSDDKTVTTPQRIVKTSKVEPSLIHSNWVVEQLPFPFDVIGLLPKSRQVEMVFSSLIETLPQAAADSSDSPNENLFKLLLENMERLNDREITLTEADWQRFTQHVQSRRRNGVPLPFPEEICQVEDPGRSTGRSTVADILGADKKSRQKSALSMKWRCFIRAVAGLGCGRIILTFLPASLKHVQLMGKKGRSRSSSLGSGAKTPDQSAKKNIEAQKQGPFMTQGSLEDKSLTPTPTVERDESTFAFSPQPDSSSVKAQGTKAELSVSSDDEKKCVTFEEKTTAINEEPVFHDRCASEDSDTFSFNIPIYCYDCPLSALISVPDNKSVVESSPEEAKRREDIFQDFTQFAASIFVDPFNVDEVPRSLEGRTKGRFGASKDLLLHSNAVHDLFCRSFVSSTFTSLQHGQQLNMRDVQSAVDACEENFLEVDITEFIHTLCGHYVKKMANREAARDAQISEKFQSVPISLPPASSEERVKILKDTLLGECESVPGLHKSITAKFMSVLGRYFKAVPPSGEYFFYCPQQSEGPRKSIAESFSDFTDVVTEDDSQGQDSDIGSDTFEDVGTGILIDHDGVFHDMDDDLSDFESEGSIRESEGEAEDEEHSKSPLFLMLTCSLRDKSSHTQPMTPVSINMLPVCLGEIIRKCEDDEEFLDPFSSSVRITLDLICLTLSPEQDYSVLKSSARSAPSRSNSFSSTSSPVSLSPLDKRSGLFEFRRQDSKATSHDIDGIESMDPLHGLVHSQRQAVNLTCDTIRWLLQDEIVSELRHIGPVNSTMLEKVENHVKQSSEDHPSCISRHVRLQFVYGAEQSLELFVKEFERINLPEYSINKVEKHYYLTSFVDREVAFASPRAPEEDSSEAKREEQKAVDQGDFGCDTTTLTPESASYRLEETQQPSVDVSVNVETGEEESAIRSEPFAAKSNDLLAIYSDEQTETAQKEECSDSETSMELPVVTISDEGPGKTRDGETTLASKHPLLGDIGKQEPLQVEPSTPEKDTSFTSSANSTPLGKLVIPSLEESNAESIGIGGEDVVEDSGTPSPRTPRQEDQSCLLAEEYLPFWVVMRIFDDEVTIFFHQSASLALKYGRFVPREGLSAKGQLHRKLGQNFPQGRVVESWVKITQGEPDDSRAFCATRATGLVEMVINAIHEKCRIVNQRMLLQELYETKVCNSMLFPESDEDIWKHEELTMSVSPLGVHITKGDSKGRVTTRFVQVQFLFQPGHFGCNSVWYTHLPVHQRLMDTPGRTGISRGFKAVKSVLDRFGVSNRKDMFVYKDSDGAVFYFRLFESLCSSDSDGNPFLCELRPPDEDDDDCRSGLSSVASLAGSRTSSLLSLVKAGITELDEEDLAQVEESKLENKKKHLQAIDRDRDTASESGRSMHALQPMVDKSIALHVYGVDDPGPEITVDLVEVLQNRINEAMLEVLSVLLSRNPNCKLTYADVRFIQPQGQPPKTTLTLTVPPMDVNYLCPLTFYLRQNLHSLLHSPRYMDNNPNHHFRALSGSKTEASGNTSAESCRLEPEIYLYNRPHSSGGKGLACISASVLNSRGGYIYIPCGKTACNYVGELDYFEQMTEVFLCEDKRQLAEEDIMVQFAIWERGDIGLDQLATQLKLSLRHALCDLLTEYYLLTAPLSKVPPKYYKAPMTRQRSVSEPPSPSSLTPKDPKLGSYPETIERSSRRQLDFGSQSGFRSRTASLVGQRKTPPAGSLSPTGSTGRPGRVSKNPFLSHRRSSSGPQPISRQTTMEDDVFKTEAVSADNEDMEDKGKASETRSKKKRKSGLAPPQTAGKSEASSDVEHTFESFTAAEIQESQEFTSQPGTPVSEHLASASPDREKTRKLSSASNVSGSKAFSPDGRESTSVGRSSDGPTTWQNIEARRRKELERRMKRIQFENGERGELHSSLQGLGQDMFAFFFDLGVPSVYRIDGKLINNFASDAFLGELVSLISSLCPDLKPKIYRETPLNSPEEQESDYPPEINCPHYYPARQPLRVQDVDESTTDESGKQFAPLPNSSHFFVVVGRNVDQWRASLGLEEDLSQEPSDRPRIRTGLQRFRPLDPNAPVPGRIPSDSTSLSSLSLGGVPRQKFLLVTLLDKDVIAFTYNWANDLNLTFEKQLHRLLNWSNARCHLTACLLSQKLGLFHHTLFADINRGKEGKDMNPFCLSANDMDMVLLVSRPGPPPLDRERAMPRQMPPSPNILVFDEVLRDVTPPKPLHCAQYFHNRDLVKRHGYQFKEIRSGQIKRAILEQSLDELYIMWLRRPPHIQINEDKIETLKRSSRLIHYCAAPLLFHPNWRRKRSSTASDSDTVKEESCSDEPRKETKEKKNSKEQKHGEAIKEGEAIYVKEKTSAAEEAWHQELRSAYLQQYVQYMQSLQFIVVQTRPQSPKPNRRHNGRSNVSSKPKRETGDVKKQNSSKDRKDRTSQTLQCYLQRSSHGGIMLLELVFEGCFFIVRLYALGCSQIPSGKAVGVQMSRLFVEDCTRYREYIHLLSFNYDFHLCKAQLYLNGSQRIFNKGYGVTAMLKGLLEEYPQCPLFARNRVCAGEVAVPSHISPQAVFNYLVKNASFYDFQTLPLESRPFEKTQHLLFGTDRVLTQERYSDTRTYDILRDNYEYDITFVVSPKESSEEGIVNMEYIVLMTSRRELFPKLTLDLHLRKKSPSSSSLSTMNGNRKASLPDNGEVEPERGPRVRFTLPSSSSSGSLGGFINPPFAGEFHRSASSPHSLFALGNSESGFQFPAAFAPLLSGENIMEQRSGSNRSLAVPSYEGSLCDSVSEKEFRLITEAYQRARVHLVHVVCRAQTHCSRDMLWHRLLVGGIGEEEKDGTKKGRKRSEVRRSGSDCNVKAHWMKGLVTLYPGAEESSASRLSFEEFKQLLSVVVSKSLRDEDPQVIPLLANRASWYLNLFRIITAKFPDTHRLFVGEDSTVHYLAILNADDPDMFVLIHVDEQNDTADMLVVFREDSQPDEGGTSRQPRLLSKKIRRHVYSVVNALCFHLWTSLLQV